MDEIASAHTVSVARMTAERILAREGVSDPAADARALLAYAIGCDRSRVAIEGARELSERESGRLQAALRQRLDGRTVGRIVGERAFHDIVLATADDVLEPRDDTGALVELVLRQVRDRSALRVWDIGVGAGTVVLSLLHALPGATALGTDVNPNALWLTERNARAMGVEDRLTLRAMDGLSAVDQFDLIVSNPPYIRSGEIGGLAPEARVDPRAALDGGADGLMFYRLIAGNARARLRKGGFVAVEIGHDQEEDVTAIFRAHGWTRVDCERDLGGHVRALAFAARPGSSEASGENRAGGPA